MDRQRAAKLHSAGSKTAVSCDANRSPPPIRVNLPIDGQLFQLEKILVLDEPLFINVGYGGWKK